MESERLLFYSIAITRNKTTDKYPNISVITIKVNRLSTLVKTKIVKLYDRIDK